MASPEQDFVIVDGSDLVQEEDTDKITVDDVQKIRTWLKLTDYTAPSSEYSRHLSAFVPGTDTWINQAEYREWTSSTDFGTLWFRAIPGAGKSVAAAQLVSRLSESEDVPVLFFFFRQIIINSRTPNSLLRDWMAQLLSHSPNLQRTLHQYTKKNMAFEDIAFSDLWKDLVNALCEVPKVYCIADALDEMSLGHDDFIERLVHLGELKPGSLKVCVTSRLVPRIEKLLKMPTVLQLDMTSELTEPAISEYVKHRLQQVDVPSTTQEAVETEVLARSEGLFLYVKLMMDELLSLPLPQIGTLEARITSLPSGLAGVYTQLLQDHCERNKVPQRLQIEILRWVTHSARPLRIIELAAIIDFNVQSGKMEDVPELRGHYQNTKALIRAACGPLIEILEDETVSVLHHSLTEYVVETSRSDSTTIELSTNGFPTIDSLSSQREMAKTCIRYLTNGWVKRWTEKWPSKDEVVQERANVFSLYPFLKYASDFWSHHVRCVAERDDDLFNLLDCFTDPSSYNLTAWRLLKTECHTHVPKNADVPLNRLHVVAAEGIASYLEHLLSQNIGAIDITDRDNKTPLHHAAKRGRAATAKVLLSKGASCDPEDREGIKPLHKAAQSGHADVVIILLEAGVDPYTPKTRESGPYLSHGLPEVITLGDTPVEYAFEGGHVDAALAFIPYLDQDQLLQAVHWAAQPGKSDIVSRVLRSHEMDFDKPLRGRTLVNLAAYHHDIGLLRQLGEMGAKLDRKQSHVWEDRDVRHTTWVEARAPASTPLHAVARRITWRDFDFATDKTRAKETIGYLIESGCRLDIADEGGDLLLHVALRQIETVFQKKFYIEIATIFLEHGADPCACNGAGVQPIHMNYGEADAVRVLVNHGANIDARIASSGKTALHCAIEGSNRGGMEALLKNGANSNLYDDDGNTPLHIAMEGRFLGVDERAALLLKYGADPGARNKKRKTPLHLMARADDPEKTLSLLCNAGADIQARSVKGKSVFMSQCRKLSKPSIGFMRAMLAAGARLDDHDHQGRTVLHLLCKDEAAHVLITQLIGLGADPHVVDFAGNNMLHHLARRRQQYTLRDDEERLFDTVVGLGVDPAAVNHQGQTPAHIAAGMRPGPSGARGIDALNFWISLGHGKGIDINARDNDGITPLHIAATLSDRRVMQLMDHGADPFTLTYDGQTLLHIAARARQPNTVGLICNIFGTAHPLLNQKDDNGRTALHYACRSGRVESVRILLEGCADIKVRDNQERTPLHACAELSEENHLWSLSHTYGAQKRAVDAGGATLRDNERPRFKERQYPTMHRDRLPFTEERDEDNEVFGIGVRHIARLLVQAGATTTAPDGSRYATSRIDRMLYPAPVSPMKYAIGKGKGCGTMVDELRKFDSLAHPSEPNDDRQVHSSTISAERYSDRIVIETHLDYLHHYLTGSLSTFNGLLTPHKEKTMPKEGADKQTFACARLFRTLLTTENEKTVIQYFKAHGDTLDHACLMEPLKHLVTHGYADLLSTLSADTMHAVEHLRRKDAKERGRPHTPLLHIACGRDFPNLAVVKVLIDEKGFDVVEKDTHDACASAFHVLARSSHWWKAHGIAYLAEHTSTVNIQNKHGETPLHIAANLEARANVDTLLKHGANPNALTSGRMTCLSKAARSPQILRQLIDYGANVNLGKFPFVFKAIDMENHELVVKTLRHGGDPNADLDPKNFDDDFRMSAGLRYMRTGQGKKIYPLQLAAGPQCDVPDKTKMMIPIIETLLAHGADPFKHCLPGQAILHTLCEYRGIISPFLTIPGLDLEKRDSGGNTLLLSASVHRHVNHYWNDSSKTYDARMGFLKSTAPLVKELVERGADPLARNYKHQNVLHRLFSLPSSKKECGLLEQDFKYLTSLPSFESLLGHVDNDGKTVLHYVLSDPSYLCFARDLLAAGANASTADTDGNTVLHCLARHFVPYNNKHDEVRDERGDSDLAVAKDLLVHFLHLGLNINATNVAGRSPLHTAIQHNILNPSSLDFFFAHGADVRAKDDEGQGFLHVLAATPIPEAWYELERRQERERTEALWEALVRNGLRPEEEDAKGRSAVDLAVASGRAQYLSLGRKVERVAEG